MYSNQTVSLTPSFSRYKASCYLQKFCPEVQTINRIPQFHNEQISLCQFLLIPDIPMFTMQIQIPNRPYAHQEGNYYQHAKNETLHILLVLSTIFLL